MKEDHFISKCYLRGWTLPKDGRILVTKPTGKPFLAGLGQVGYERGGDIVDWPDGPLTENLRKIRQGVEDEWHKLRLSIEAQAISQRISNHNLDTIAKASVLMTLYTPAGRGFFGRFLSQKPIHDSVAAILPPTIRVDHHTIETIKQQHLKGHEKELIVTDFSGFVKQIKQASWTFYVNKNRRFCTSDQPIIIEARNIIYFPITPSVCLRTLFLSDGTQRMELWFDRDDSVSNYVNALLASNNERLFSLPTEKEAPKLAFERLRLFKIMRNRLHHCG